MNKIKMEVAQCRVIVDRFGSDVPKLFVTPAEAQVLRVAYMDRVGRDPITDLQLIGVVQRPLALERQRLLQKYGNLKTKTQQGKTVPVVETAFPGAYAVLPTSFEQMGYTGIPVATKVGALSHKPTPEGDVEDPEWAAIEAELQAKLDEQLKASVVAEAGAVTGVEKGGATSFMATQQQPQTLTAKQTAPKPALKEVVPPAEPKPPVGFKQPETPAEPPKK